MNVAMVAPVIRKISASNLYGGIERIIASIAIGVANAGHHVVLYAPYGTDLIHENIEIRLTTTCDVANQPELVAKAEDDLFQQLFVQQGEFNLIHTHLEPMVAKSESGNLYGKIQTPIVVTMHNQSHLLKNIKYYESHSEIHNLHFVFISHDQASPLPFLPHQSVIYNGININHLTFNTTPNSGQLAFLGRITPEKGIVEAIAIAKLSGKKLIIGAAIDLTEKEYYERNVKPLIDGETILYLGEIGNDAKNELLRTSEALLFPIRWHEPFGLVVVEAMATGTPVLAPNIGSMQEIIQDGKTGFLVPPQATPGDYAKKLAFVGGLSRNYCRQVVEEKFTETTMVANYLSYYKTLL